MIHRDPPAANAPPVTRQCRCMCGERFCPHVCRIAVTPIVPPRCRGSRNYQVGAASAAQKAITTYDEIVRRYPKSEQADYARLALPRLVLGIDTGQRRFFCVYD